MSLSLLFDFRLKHYFETFTCCLILDWSTILKLSNFPPTLMKLCAVSSLFTYHMSFSIFSKITFTYFTFTFTFHFLSFLKHVTFYLIPFAIVQLRSNSDELQPARCSLAVLNLSMATNVVNHDVIDIKLYINSSDHPIQCTPH